MKHSLNFRTTVAALALLAAGLLPQQSSADIISWQGGAGDFSDANWTVDGVTDQNHSGFSTGDHDTTISSGTVNFTTDTTTPAGFFLQSGDSLTINGGAINGNFLALDAPATVLNLESGTITLSAANGIRSVTNSFNGQLNWTGSAGAATITQTDNTVVGASLAGKVSNANGLFAIDGTQITPTVAYDGTNLAAVNANLATLAVGGRYFQVTEAGGTQSLTTVATAVPEPTSLGILAVAGLGFVFRRRK